LGESGFKEQRKESKGDGKAEMSLKEKPKPWGGGGKQVSGYKHRDSRQHKGVHEHLDHRLDEEGNQHENGHHEDGDTEEILELRSKFFH